MIQCCKEGTSFLEDLLTFARYEKDKDLRIGSEDQYTWFYGGRERSVYCRSFQR